jgi:para-nitrobenzyl esterase
LNRETADCLLETRYGLLRGTAEHGVQRYLGVPYAAPPVGELRWRAPQEPQAWTGVRDARLPGANAPQIRRAFPGLDITPLVGLGWRPGDDFLTANVWTPAAAGAARPVLVFIHGGAFVGGSSDAAVHAGTEFARSGIVYVAINYRLAVEGFLPIDGAVTNLGLRDQIAALRWVRANIADFGGDPHNVTVAGESAGAMSIANLMASPLASGLLRRAIVQSGHGSMVRPLAVARRLTQKLAETLSVSPDRDGFARLSTAQCAAAADAISRPEVALDLRDSQGRDGAYGLTRFLPVFGDDVLPDAPLTALAKGLGADVDLLIGTNREEMNIYLVPTGVRQSISAGAATALLAASEPHAADVLRRYGLDDAKRRPGDALAEAMTDLVFRGPARRFAAAHRGRTHFYEFGWRSPACGGELGACHALELPFVFKTLPSCTGPAALLGSEPPAAIAERVHGIWVDFVVRGSLPWHPYTLEAPECLALESGAVARDALTQLE